MKTHQPLHGLGSQPNLGVLQKTDAPQQGVGTNDRVGSTTSIPVF